MQDVDHSAAQTLLDWDWLGGGDGLAELGVVTSPTARALSTRTCVTLEEETHGAPPPLMGGSGLTSKHLVYHMQ